MFDSFLLNVSACGLFLICQGYVMRLGGVSGAVVIAVFRTQKLHSFINYIVKWNRKPRRFSWVFPVLLSVVVTMAVVTAFDLVTYLLRVEVSVSRAYLVPLICIGALAGITTFVAILVYRKMAEQTVEEVNERLRVSGELVNEQMLMRSLMENTPDHIYFKDAEGRFIRINKSMAQDLGMRNPSRAIGKTDTDFFAPAIAAAFVEEEKIIRLTGAPVLGKEEHRMWPDSRETWMSATKLPLRDRHGQVIGTFGIARDITAFKKTEIQIRQLSRAVEQSPSIVLITDVSGNITYVNPKFTAVTGYQPQDILGKNPRFLRGEGTSPTIFKDMWSTIMDGEEWNGEILNQKKDGEQFWGLASISPIRNQEGKVTHYLEVMEDITQRKHAEQALRRQFVFQRQLMDAIPVPIFHKDTMGYYKECNEAFTQFIGRSRDEIIGHTAHDVAPPELAKHYHEQDVKLIEQGGTQQYENLVLHADGTRHNVMFSKALVHDDTGQTSGIVGAIVDLTPLRRVEEALSKEYERREELEKIISKSPAIVFLWRNEPGWPVEYVSNSVEQLGYTTQDFLTGGFPFSQIVHPEDLPRIGAEVEEYSRKGLNEFDQEYRVFSKRGEVRWIDDRTWVRRDDAGNITHYQGVVMDITERKISDEREEATMAGLRAILEIADELISASDTDEIFRLAVDRSRKKLKLERTAIMIVDNDEIRGTYGTNLKGRTVEERDHLIHFDDKWKDRLRPRKPGEKPWVIVSEPYYEWDGESMVGFGQGWVAITPILSHEHGAVGLFCNDSAISGAPVDEVSQEILAVFCVMLGNIIARKLAEEEQEMIQEQHREIMERTDRMNSLGILAAGMAHEINNPLQGMISHLNNVHRAVEDDEATRKSLSMVERGIDTIATLIRKLLIFGRTNEKEGESVECREALEFVSQLLTSQFKQSGVTIEVKVRHPNMVVAMQRRYLTQVLLNLFINARDAMPDGGVINVLAERKEDQALISITDQGCGIPEKELPEIFKPFHTTKGAKGSGLGLSVADSLMRSSNGSIQVKSQPGKTTFTLKIPMVKKET